MVLKLIPRCPDCNRNDGWNFYTYETPNDGDKFGHVCDHCAQIIDHETDSDINDAVYYNTKWNRNQS